MTKFLNMKIAITPEQPFDDVVVELERLGFENCTTFNSKNVQYLIAFEDHKTFTDYFFLVNVDIDLVNTNLTELKEME